MLAALRRGAGVRRALIAVFAVDGLAQALTVVAGGGHCAGRAIFAGFALTAGFKAAVAGHRIAAVLDAGGVVALETVDDGCGVGRTDRGLVLLLPAIGHPVAEVAIVLGQAVGVGDALAGHGAGDALASDAHVVLGACLTVIAFAAIARGQHVAFSRLGLAYILDALGVIDALAVDERRRVDLADVWHLGFVAEHGAIAQVAIVLFGAALVVGAGADESASNALAPATDVAGARVAHVTFVGRLRPGLALLQELIVAAWLGVRLAGFAVIALVITDHDLGQLDRGRGTFAGLWLADVLAAGGVVHRLAAHHRGQVELAGGALQVAEQGAIAQVAVVLASTVGVFFAWADILAFAALPRDADFALRTGVAVIAGRARRHQLHGAATGDGITGVLDASDVIHRGTADHGRGDHLALALALAFGQIAVQDPVAHGVVFLGLAV